MTLAKAKKFAETKYSEACKIIGVVMVYEISAHMANDGLKESEIENIYYFSGNWENL